MKIIKNILILCLVTAFLISLVTVSSAVSQKDNNAADPGLEGHEWKDGKKKEHAYASLDEVAIFRDGKNADEMAKSFDPGAKVIKDYEYLIIVSLPNQMKSKDLDDKIVKYNKDTGNKADLVFYKKSKKEELSRMALTGEIIVHFKQDWDENRITEWAKTKSIEIIQKYPFSSNTYLFKVGPGLQSLDLANQIYLSGDVIYSYPNWWKVMERRAIPNDALFSNQWHLRNTVQGGGTSGEDVNITSIWDTFTGSSNEVIAVVDDGLEIGHEDIAPNVLAGYSYDYVDHDGNPTAGKHGTSVAGVAAAKGNNSKGVTGAGPNTKLIGYRLLDAWTANNEADALIRNDQVVDIYSNSWGPADDRHLDAPGPLTKDAFANGVTNGRGSKGNVYVWAGGNGNNNTNNLYDDNSNYDGYANSRYIMAIAASNNYGTQSWYSEDGANILVNTPSSGGSLGITTTDRTGFAGYDHYRNYYNNFGGTSSAAPLASGIISLMLQANPSLSWRDIRLILAASAEKNNPTDSDWTTNGAGYNINHKYGFGRIDATKAVKMAIGWTNAGPEISVEAYKSPNIAIPDNNTNGISDTITINQNIKVEFVEIYFTTADHTYWGDLDIELTSPSGTKSKLATKHYVASGYDSKGYDNWVFGDVRHLGELSQGTWTLKVKDLWAQDVGTLQNWGIKIYGTEIGGTVNNQLSVTVSESPDPATSGGTSQVTTHVERQCGTEPGEFCIAIYPPPMIPAQGVNVVLSTTGGALDYTNGVTDANGNFTATYTAPSVSTSTVYTISATASKSGYTDGSGSDQITVSPSGSIPLVVSVSESPDPVISGQTSQVTINVIEGCPPGNVCATVIVPVEGASISLSATGGTFNPSSGATDPSGNFVTTYTSPSVTSSTTFTISAAASKSGYTDGSGSDQITVNPQQQLPNVVISSAIFDAFGTDNQYNINWEYVRITNRGTTSQSLTGWQLLNKTNNVLYTIPTFTLGAGSTVTVYSGTGINSGTRLYMKYNRHVWANSGECARLKDNSGNLISEYCI